MPRRPEDLELTGLAELCPIGVGPLEVVAQDLLELGEPIAGGLLEPVREALVEDRPRPLEQTVVRRVANQRGGPISILSMNHATSLLRSIPDCCGAFG